MTIRMIDYYVKNLPFDARQEIFYALERVNVLEIEKMLEKEAGYPRFRSVGYSDEMIASHLKKKSLHFARVNELMIKNERPPLFDDPFDTYACSIRYVEIMRRYRQSENDSKRPSSTVFGNELEWVDVLIEKMGCTWDDYIPEHYPN